MDARQNVVEPEHVMDFGLMLEPRRDQRPGQGQPEHVIGHAETGIPVEDNGCWEDSEQAEDQDPLAFSISASRSSRTIPRLSGARDARCRVR